MLADYWCCCVWNCIKDGEKERDMHCFFNWVVSLFWFFIFAEMHMTFLWREDEDARLLGDWYEYLEWHYFWHGQAPLPVHLILIIELFKKYFSYSKSCRLVVGASLLGIFYACIQVLGVGGDITIMSKADLLVISNTICH